MLEFDLEYQKELCELHDYPLALDKIEIKRQCCLNINQKFFVMCLFMKLATLLETRIKTKKASRIRIQSVTRVKNIEFNTQERIEAEKWRQK